MAFSKARRLGDLVTNVDGNLTAVEDIQLGADGFSELNINSTRTDGNIGGTKFRTNGTVKGSIYGTTDGQIVTTVDGEVSEAMRIKADGKVGIGTANPSQLLTIESNSFPILQISNTLNNNPTDGVALDLVEKQDGFAASTATFGQTGVYGYRLKLNGSTNHLILQSGSQTTTNDRVTVERDTGNVTINTGNLVMGTSGKGIDFSATGGGINSSSVSSSLLDDYEEGTWTPTFAGVACAAVYGATYVKIGQFVLAEAYIAGDTQNNSSQFRIAGLPYTSVNQTTYGGGSIGYTYSQDWSEIGAPIIPGNSSYAYFHRINGVNGINSIINSYIYNKVSGNQLILFQLLYKSAS